MRQYCLPSLRYISINKLIFFITILMLHTSLSLAEENYTKKTFPVGEVFEPLVADVKEAQFSMGFHKTHSSGRLGRFTSGIVSYGESFGLVRWEDKQANQWQLSITGALFSQFNMDAESWDLINADYVVGLSASHRRKAFSYRVTLLHQSTHLGDEFLLSENAPDQRINFSMELIEGLISYDWWFLRFYGGGAYILHVEPRGVDKVALQYGSEFHLQRWKVFNGRWIGGVNIFQFEGDNWGINTTAKAGLEFGKPGSGNRRIRLLLEAYKGHSPFGQFIDLEITSYGMSVYLGF